MKPAVEERLRKMNKSTLHPAVDPETWQMGDQIKSLEDSVIGSVVEVGYSAVKVQWSDGMTSCVGRRSNVAGRFEKVA